MCRQVWNGEWVGRVIGGWELVGGGVILCFSRMTWPRLFVRAGREEGLESAFF